ncbi:uncharacterized protein [Eurosta solidaginis]|uniref:uncharacterized protein n=1 Tax=Eurosta solidaginis TaxID=178769 RepID=UPI0035316B40
MILSSDVSTMDKANQDERRSNIRVLSTQAPFTEPKEQVTRPETIQSNTSGHIENIDQALHHCRNSKGELCEFIKNESIHDNQSNIVYSNDVLLTQAPFTEPKEQVTKPESVQSNTSGHIENIDQALNHCRNSQGELCEFIKNESIHDNESNVVYSDDVLLTQAQFTEPKEQVTKKEAVQSNTSDHIENIDQALDHCRNSQGELCEFIKNESIHDNESNIVYSDDDTRHSTLSGKNCNDSQSESSQSVKNEHIKGDDPHIEYSDGDTIHSTIFVKHDEISIEPEEIQINMISSLHNCHLCKKSFKKLNNLNKHLKRHKTRSEQDPKDLRRSSRFQKKDSQQNQDDKKHNNSKYVYTCEVCKKKYKTQFLLTKHIRIRHTKEKPNRNLKQHFCNICNKGFRNTYELKIHEQSKHTGERSHLCSACGKSFLLPRHLRMHRLNNCEDRPYVCPYCPLRYTNNPALVKHKETHEGIKRQPCDICGKNIVVSHLKTHKLIHSNEKPHKCKFCERRFTYALNLRRHIRTHTGEKPYKCEYCECTFAVSGSVLSHLRTHLGKNIHRCEFCPSTFPHFTELRTHLTTHKDEDPETRERNMTALKEEEAKLKQNLANKKIQQPPKPKRKYSCNFCNKDFTTSSKLKRHIRMHTGERPYSCSECGKSFSLKSNLKQHSVTHESRDRQPCDICGKSIIKSILEKHKLIHNEPKLLKCDICEKRFRVNNDLKIHMRIHTGEKPFKCTYCENAFIVHSALMTHLRNHLSDNVYRCKFCPQGFTTALKLSLHLPTHKDDDRETRERNMKALKEEEAKLKQQHLEEKAIEQKRLQEGGKRKACDICGKMISTGQFSRHKLYHSGKKPHKCGFCDKGFVAKSHLRRHLNIHTGEKPHKCKYCERAFKDSTALIKHLHVHLGANVFRCEFCPQAFPSASKRRVHLATHKDEDSKTRKQNMKALREVETKLRREISKNKNQQSSKEKSKQTNNNHPMLSAAAYTRNNPPPARKPLIVEERESAPIPAGREEASGIRERELSRPDIKVNTGVRLLSGEAREWYWLYIKSHARVDWPSLQLALLRQYSSQRTDFEILRELTERKQRPGENIDEYFHAVGILHSRLKNPIPEYEIVRLVKGNLCESLAKMVYPIPAYSLDQLRMECKEVERCFPRRDRTPLSTFTPRAQYVNEVYQSEDDERFTPGDEGQVTVEEIRHQSSNKQAGVRRNVSCWNCGADGHFFTECMSLQRRIFCYKCGKQDVITPKCPMCNPAGNASRNAVVTGNRAPPKPRQKQKIYLGVDFWRIFELAPEVISVNEIDLTKIEKEMVTGEDKNERSVLHSLTPEQKERLEKVVKSFRTYEEHGLGRTSLEKHTIKLVDEAVPIKERHYPLSPAMQAIVYEEVDKMLELGVIEKSESPWSNRTTVVRKPGKNRFCLDARKLNAVTVKDAYPLQNIEGILSRIDDTHFISSVDLKFAFWQIELDDESKPYTAFTVPGRPLYQFVTMPFGLCNAAQRLCRLMDRVIPQRLKSNVFIYLDDLLIIAPDFDSHLRILQEVVICLRDANLTIGLKKSRFCFKELPYLGYIVGGGMLKTDAEKIKAIQKIPVPKTVKDVRSFLGTVGWYRRFIKDFATMAAPLTDSLKKGKKFEMSEEAVEAFNSLKRALTSAPVLRHPDFSKRFFIQCDASDYGLSAVLYQKESDDAEKPIAYFSQKFNDCQRKYSTTEKECLAAVMAVKRFRPYIDLMPFTIVTDHARLKWLMSLKDLNGRLARWSLQLQAFNFEIEHRKGADNIMADTLSRCIAEITESPIANMDTVEFESKEYKELISTIENNTDRLPDLKAMREATASNVVKFLTEEIFHKFGVPEIVHSDNGKQFVSKQFTELLETYGVRHLKTAFYSPQSKAAERANQSVLAAIRSVFNNLWEKLYKFTKGFKRTKNEPIEYVKPNIENSIFKNSEDYLIEFIKNDPNEDVEPNIEEGDGATEHSTISGENSQDGLDCFIKNEPIDAETNIENSMHLAISRKICKNSEDHLMEFIKNDPSEEFDPNVEDSDGATMHSTISGKNSQDVLGYFIKNEPIEDETNSEYSEVGTLHSTISAKNEELAIDFDEQQIPRANLEMQHLNLSEDKPYKCPQCPLRFLYKYGMSRHQQIHVGIKRQPCDICGKIVRKAELRQHKRIHSGEKPHKCDICEKRFYRKSYLKTHLRTHTGEKPFKCKYCGHVFATRTGMLNHLRIHMGDNIYICEFCPLAFATASVRRLHSAAHIDDDPETRERNMKALIEKETKLKTQQLDMETAEHKIYNGSIKGYECDVCRKSFRVTSSLTLHEFIHRGERPHKCKFCELRFTQAPHLQRHMRIHTGEKPFNCKYCTAAFPAKGEVLSHLRTHLGVNIHRCEFCPLAFPSASKRRLHSATHKDDDPETRERNMKALREEEAKIVALSRMVTQQTFTEESHQQLRMGALE